MSRVAGPIGRIRHGWPRDSSRALRGLPRRVWRRAHLDIVVPKWKITARGNAGCVMRIQGISMWNATRIKNWPSFLYSKYTEPLGQLLLLLLMLYHFYADDTQVMKSANPQSSVSFLNAVNALERAIAKVAEWMRSNKLKLNCDKTKFLIFGSKCNLKKCNVQSINICGETVFKTSSAQNLGVMMDKKLSMLPHVIHVVKTLSLPFMCLVENMEISMRRYNKKYGSRCHNFKIRLLQRNPH